jgi:DNA polymerase
VAELACGYGGGVGALTAMGALDLGIKESELQSIVTAWRKASPHIVEFWWAADRASKKAIEQETVTSTNGLVFEYKSGMLFITLPSGRKLAYVKPRIETNKFGSASITYEGIGATKKWERIETYGPKLVENIVQATARDILCYAMKTLKDYRIVAHVHDELIIEAPMDENAEHISSLMSKSPEWCQDLLLNADGYECNFYKKD